MIIALICQSFYVVVTFHCFSFSCACLLVELHSNVMLTVVHEVISAIWCYTALFKQTSLSMSVPFKAKSSRTIWAIAVAHPAITE